MAQEVQSLHYNQIIQFNNSTAKVLSSNTLSGSVWLQLSNGDTLLAKIEDIYKENKEDLLSDYQKQAKNTKYDYEYFTQKIKEYEEIYNKASEEQNQIKKDIYKQFGYLEENDLSGSDRKKYLEYNRLLSTARKTKNRASSDIISASFSAVSAALRKFKIVSQEIATRAMFS